MTQDSAENYVITDASLVCRLLQKHMQLLESNLHQHPKVMSPQRYRRPARPRR